jgi:hypothetical protein
MVPIPSTNTKPTTTTSNKTGDTTKSPKAENEIQDAHDLLQENIILLRDAYKHVNSENAALREVAELKNQLKKYQNESFSIKRFIFLLGLVLNLIISVGFCVSGPLLWFYNSISINFWWTVLGGLFWLSLTILVSQEPWK